MKTNIDIDALAKDFEKYIAKFDEIRALAIRFKTTPNELIDMFFGIGLEALNQTENILKREFEVKLKEVFASIKQERKGQPITYDS